MDSIGPFSARRIPFGPAAKVKNEVLVSYQSTDVRDAVKSAARNLAGKGSDFGVRLEVPDHLKSALKALQAMSFEIKQKYPSARRNVLFDDESQDLVLDFSVAEGNPWRRMSATQAKERKKKMPGPNDKLALDDNEVDSILDRPVARGSDEESQV